MHKNTFPPLEPENSLPENLPDIPERMESLEDFPVIEELSFARSIPQAPVEAEPENVPPAELLPEAPVIDEITFQEETFPVDPIAITDQEICFPTEDSLDSPEITEPVISAVPEEASSLADFDAPMVSLENPSADPTNVLPENTKQAEEVSQSDEEVSELLEIEEMITDIPVEVTEDQEYRDDGQDFEKLMNASAPQPEKSQPVPQASTYKGRPKRKKGEGLLGIPSILATFVWLALIVIIGVTAGRMLWICAADVLAFGREDKVVTVTVYESDTMEEIIDKLHDAGLIRYKSLFSLYAGISDAEEDIKPGIYDLNTRYDYHALVNFMSPRSSREVIKLTIPEGYTCRQIFALLEENRICTARDAAAYAANGELSDYWFLEDLERGAENALEGYLFPDTYEFYKNSTPREAIERMLDNFENRFDEEMVSQLESINDQFRCEYGVREIVIIASLIEKESAAPAESPMISGVIYNRLFRWGNNRPLLNIDASIVYAQEGNNARIDTSLESPYNTYLYEGLTPGPIANPGLASLKAALNPETHNYYYYVLNPSSSMHQFSTTYEEHQGYVREFNAAPEIEIE